MVNDSEGIVILISEAKGTVAVLNIHLDDREVALQQLNQRDMKGNCQPKETSSCNVTVSLPLLQLPLFSGDPKSWRKFWNTFEAAVHLQAISGIQQFNYLMSCLRKNALLAVKGYDIAPKESAYRKIRPFVNYKGFVIRRVTSNRKK
ncbi:unnamed protein product [Litomosoides sigmodontis]|uniref:Uncharacterized protein n=1 Tax=Litomosoides sigmodontis TaxID=42156 RepID=A0A3P6T9A5_LITSI|nr:unnamed protein product [Litomosoides sigmodontis]